MRYFICLFLIFSASLNAGNILKWVDEEGNVHYGDAPPVSAKTEPVKVIGVPSNPGKALPRLGTGDESNSGSTSNVAETETKADPSNVPDDQAKSACDEARKDLKTISKSSRVRLRMADGSTRIMTTEEIAERRIQAEKDVENYCR